MKRENFVKAKEAIEKASSVEYLLNRINASDPDSPRWDWVPASLHPRYVHQVMCNLTDVERTCLDELKNAMTVILRKAAVRTLDEINYEISQM